MTSEIAKALSKYPLYSQERVPNANKRVLAKFFAPWCAWTWYVTEGERRGDDWLFFGLVINGYGEKEWGYFTLGEMAKINGPLGLKIERDRYLEKDATIANAVA